MPMARQRLNSPRSGPRPIEDSEILTQLGCELNNPPFHTQPNRLTPRAMSVLRGRLNVEETARYVRRKRKPLVSKEGKIVDVVRYTTAGTFRKAGFKVVPTPSSRNPCHVSVESADLWETEVAAKFDACFTGS